METVDDPDPYCGMYRYCFSSFTEWKLSQAAGSRPSVPMVQLTVTTTQTLAQDTDWNSNTTSNELIYRVRCLLTAFKLRVVCRSADE
jgi:hypothetical protein